MSGISKRTRKRKPSYMRRNNETKIALGLFVLLVIFVLVVRYFF
jgi:hypothetical protein